MAAEGKDRMKRKSIDTAERRRLVIAMRKKGTSYWDIADDIRLIYKTRGIEDELPAGWDSRYAWKDFHRELKAIREEILDDMEDVLEIEKQRLDSMQEALWAKAVDDSDKDQGASVDRILKIMQRRAKLYGLDAPETLKVEALLEGELKVGDDQITRSLAALADVVREGISGTGTERESALDSAIDKAVASLPDPS